jgi:hypothetical protein
LDELDREITRILAEDRRRSHARRVMSGAMSAHRAALCEGREMVVANQTLLEFLARDVDDKGEDLFSKAFRLMTDTAMGSVIRPMIDSLLKQMGLKSHPKLRALLKNIIESTFSSIVSEISSGEKSFSDIWNCEVIADELAKSTAEALPKTIFDTFLSSRAEPTGIALTIREGIANYFRDAKTVKEIADTFKEFVCKKDFAGMLSGAAGNIKQGISQS